MKVRMINSVGDVAAGQEVELSDELSDRYILLGYAEGELSRDYDDAEQAAMRENHQVVSA